eukprot:3939386-Rhodomonas_salina.5
MRKLYEKALSQRCVTDALPTRLTQLAMVWFAVAPNMSRSRQLIIDPQQTGKKRLSATLATLFVGRIGMC